MSSIQGSKCVPSSVGSVAVYLRRNECLNQQVPGWQVLLPLTKPSEDLQLPQQEVPPWLL
jgi:hypothetical protein